MHLQEQFDLQQLFTFYVAAGSRTFTEAAERLHVSQSAVSHSIRKLERSVGFRLIVRDHAPIRLTESGRLLFETCGRVFSDIGRCRDAIHQSDPKTLAGRLMVGATVEFGNSVLASGIAPFINKHPNIEIGFTFSHELLKLLRADELDLIIDCRVHTRQDLSRTVLFREKYVLVAAPKLMKTANIDCLADLERVSWLSLDAEGNWWQRLLVQLPPKSELNPTRLIPVNHLRGLINMAVSGIGVGLVPAYCVQNELRQGRLKMLFPEMQIREDRFFLYCKTIRKLDPKIAAFTAFVKGLHLGEPR